MSITAFSLARLPRIEFASGAFARLPEIIASYGNKCLLITGKESFQESQPCKQLLLLLEKLNVDYDILNVENEPSPQLVDESVSRYHSQAFDVVVGIGGGSALDAAKAIAGLLNMENSVLDYLEGVGPEISYIGPAVPFIAVPTTAGTGSEATKNAVLSTHGIDGYKKSFRSEQLVAEYAIIDPDLLASCPKSVIAANGMDALTQLIESYVSTNSNILTDALVVSGLRAARDGLIPWYEHPENSTFARQRMAYAALISGISLAQVGLGSVHGLASPLGAFYPIPHGVVCGTLVAEATQVNIDTMVAREPDNRALLKYAHIGEILCNKEFDDPNAARDKLLELLYEWTRRLNLPLLSQFEVGKNDIYHIVAHSRGSSMKTNPIELHDEEIARIIRARL